MPLGAECGRGIEALLARVCVCFWQRDYCSCVCFGNKLLLAQCGYETWLARLHACRYDDTCVLKHRHCEATAGHAAEVTADPLR